MFRKIIFIFTIFMSSGLSSQTLDNPWAVDINLNFREYNGDLGNQFLKFNDNNAQIGLGLNRYVKPWLNIRAFGNYGKSFYKGNSPDSGISNTLNISAFNVGLQGQFKLNNGIVLKENARVGPYLGLGLSYWNFKNEDIGNSSKNVLALGVPLSAGINFNINPRVNISAQTTYNLVFSDKIDQYAKSSNDKLLQYSISVIFNFGNRSKAALKKKDSDKDGVSDRIDRCPGTKIGVAVDEFGCEIISLKANKEIKGIVNNLLFETNQTELKESSKQELDKIVEILKRHTDGILIIEGHTDNVGNPEYNLSLSSRRAESVRNYIISKGIAKDRLVSKGYGQTLSLTSNKTAEGRELNRRVELILTK